MTLGGCETLGINDATDYVGGLFETDEPRRQLAALRRVAFDIIDGE